MKVVMISLLALLMSGASVYAEETNATSKAGTVVTETKKKPRKKKVEMCAECGKPESECDCPGYEHNKGKKSTDKKDEHDGHSH